jgi:hypothetical protein
MVMLAAVAVVWGSMLLWIASDAQASETPLDVEHTSAEIQEAEESASPLTNPHAAEELPHRDLGRGESEELLQAVFGPLIEAPAGIFSDLHVEEFLSNDTAVVSASQISGLAEEAEPAEAGRSFLLESTTPLRTEAPDGGLETVDLGLEGTSGGLRPTNPLIELEIPDQLGDGIELPEAGIQIELQGAPAERSPSTVGETVAFYPNVAPDTDLAVSPTPAGVETLTQLRSTEAPRTQTFNLHLPAGATLEETSEGGAIALLAGEPLMTILPPTATDAAGASVPTQLAVEGDSLRITASPGAKAQYPIVVDPNMWDNYNWYSEGHSGWEGFNTGGYTNAFRAPDTGCSTYCYLRTSAMSGTYETNTQSYWQYAVPRFFTDFANPEVKEHPRSWIQAFQVGQITFATQGDWQASPDALFAVSDESGAWRSASLYAPNISGGYSVNLNADHTGKLASFGLFSTTHDWISTERYLLTGESQVALGDETAPVFGSVSSPPWVNAEAKPFNMTVTDAGLGVHQLVVRKSNGESIGTTAVAGNCQGTVRSACPRTWKGAQEGHTVSYAPASLPQGTNNLKLEALDPVANTSSTTLQVKVDHTAPTLSLSGSMTEQAKVGKTLPQYTVRLEGKDGSTESPQSGLASAEVKVDGKQVASWSPGCTTQNCSLTQEWTLKSSEYLGKHKVEVIATDAVGLKTTKTIEVEEVKDTTMPQISVGGALFTTPEGWLEQKSYGYTATATDPGGYGITALTLKIDGKAVNTATQTCPAGGCSKSWNTSINMASYAGGEHTAELIATDGAGNTAKQSWTLNMDPQGNIGAGEAAATLEAADSTSESMVVSSNEEMISQEEREEGDDPSVVKEGSVLISTGTPTKVEYSTTPSEGVTVSTPEGPIQIAPIGASASEQSTNVVNGSVSVTSNSQAQVDTIVRPIFDGVMNFQAIRAITAPESYSWQVELGPGQYLEQISEQNAVELYYEGGTPAMQISAEQAHDATGATVPTTLEKTGSDEITLHVKHKGGNYVYPILAGPSFGVGYQATVITEPIIEGPPPKEGYWESGEIIVGPPEPIPSGEASISMVGGSRKEFLRVICGHSEFYDGGYNQGCGNPFKKEIGFQTPWQLAMRGAFFYKPGKEVEERGAIACAGLAWETSTISRYYPEPAYQCHYGPKTSDGNGGVTASAGHYLRAQAHWKLGHNAKCIEGCPGENPVIWEDKAMELHLWPSGIVDETVPN